MTRFIVVFLSLSLFSFTIFGQEKKLNLEITHCNSKGNIVDICLHIKNLTECKIVTYIPKNDDICYGLIEYCIVDLKNSKIHEYLPYYFRASADHIVLNDNNTICLKPGETFCHRVQLSKDKIYPSLQKMRFYNIQIKWYFEGVEFKSKYENLFQEDIVSNRFTFRY